MTALQLRKKTLLLEGDLNRLTLHAECANLRDVTSRVGPAKELRQHLAPWAMVLAPLAVLALALGLRRSSAGTRFLARALAGAPSLNARSGLQPLLAERDDLITLLAHGDAASAERLANASVSVRKMFDQKTDAP